jgi:WD repeat and SOF domain-containing protein 1
MKVKVLNRSDEEFTRERAQDVKKVHRNYDPTLHPMQKATEVTRALAAAKLERVFAKPFVAALAHADGVTALARNPRRLNSVVAGSADGDVRIWDIPAKRTLRRLVGHSGAVRGIGFAPGGEACVTAGSDAGVKLWKVPYAPFEAGDVCAEQGPVLEFGGRHPFRGVDHHWQRSAFATAGATVELWDHARSEPVASYTWGSDGVTSVRFNPVRRKGFWGVLGWGRGGGKHVLFLLHYTPTSHTLYTLLKTKTKQTTKTIKPKRPSPTSLRPPAPTAPLRCTTCAPRPRRCASSSCRRAATRSRGTP